MKTIRKLLNISFSIKFLYYFEFVSFFIIYIFINVYYINYINIGIILLNINLKTKKIL